MDSSKRFERNRFDFDRFLERKKKEVKAKKWNQPRLDGTPNQFIH